MTALKEFQDFMSTGVARLRCAQTAEELAFAAYCIGNANVKAQAKLFASAHSVTDGGELLAKLVRLDIALEDEEFERDKEDIPF